MKISVESVYSASKRFQKVTTAAASITIVTSDEIRRYGYRTLGEILQNVPGFYITYDRNYTYAAVQGFGPEGDYNSRILLLVDGHRINDDIYDQAPLGTEFPVDVDLIARVEVIQGPGSSIYGSNAFFGVVNVITRKADSLSGVQVSISGDSQMTGYARLTAGGQLKAGLKAFVSATLYSTPGTQDLFFSEFGSPATNNGIVKDSDHDRFSQFLANLSYGDLTFQAVYGSRHKQIPTASFGTVFASTEEQTTDGHGYFDLVYSHTFRGNLILSARTSLDNYWYSGNYPYNYAPQDTSQITINHDASYGSWWAEEVQLSKTVFKHHLVTVGGDYRHNFRIEQQNYDLQPYQLYLSDYRSSRVYAFYAQDDYSIRKNLLLSAGVRHDQDSTSGGTTNPRIGLIYDPFEHTTLKFLYGTAFRAPNAYELHYQSSIANLPNPQLRPETIRSAQVILEQYFGSTHRFSAGYFRDQMNHLIGEMENAGGVLQYQNVGAVQTQGTQATFEAKWSSGFATQASYTYEHPVDQHPGEIVGNIPAHLLNANLLVPFFSRKLTAGLNFHYVSGRQSLAGTVVPGFAVLNVTLFSERLMPGLDLSGGVYNLFNTPYGYPGGPEHQQGILYQDGRTLRLKLTYTFGRL